MTQAIKKVESLGPNEYLPMLLEPMKKDQKTCQEGMAKLLDSEYRAMQREAQKQSWQPVDFRYALLRSFCRLWR